MNECICHFYMLKAGNIDYILYCTKQCPANIFIKSCPPQKVFCCFVRFYVKTYNISTHVLFIVSLLGVSFKKQKLNNYIMYC